MKYFIVIALMLLTNTLSAEEKKFEYISVEKLHNIKLSIDVRALKKMPESDLEKSAKSIYREKKGSIFQRVFITWYLPGMKVGSGAWATTHFTPTLRVDLMEWMFEYNPPESKFLR